jgi:two-component system sensor histidine kinase KdpD
MRLVPRSFAGSAIRAVATLAIVAGATAACRFADVNATTTGFVYLIAVLLVAAAWGIVESVVASVAGMLCFNFFFFPPVGTLTITDPHNWIALFSFLLTAIVASELSARAKQQARAAIERQRELERLYALGRSILLDQGGGPLAQRLAHNVAHAFELPSATLHDFATEKEYRAGADDLAIPPEVLSAALSGETMTRADVVDARFALIRLGGKPAGVLGLRGRVSDTTVDAIANLVAIGLERARTQDAETRAEAARQSEELKSMLLDAIAHEFKTPLTSIKAAATSVLSDEGVSGAHRELLGIVDEETDRLNHLVSDAIEMSRIEGGRFRLSRSSVRPADLIARVVQQMRARLAEREVRCDIEEALPETMLDRDLVELALRQLIDNAAKYSPPGAPIRIGAARRGAGIVFAVADSGPGVPPHERQQVFERFYRAPAHKSGVPGSGLGLYVVREIARAHGGDAVLAGEAAGGAQVEICVPLEEEAADRAHR